MHWIPEKKAQISCRQGARFGDALTPRGSPYPWKFDIEKTETKKENKRYGEPKFFSNEKEGFCEEDPIEQVFSMPQKHPKNFFRVS